MTQARCRQLGFDTSSSYELEPGKQRYVIVAQLSIKPAVCTCLSEVVVLVVVVVETKTTTIPANTATCPDTATTTTTTTAATVISVTIALVNY